MFVKEGTKHQKRAYRQRIREVEHASFTPVVISATGGLAHKASNVSMVPAPLLGIMFRLLHQWIWLGRNLI